MFKTLQLLFKNLSRRERVAVAIIAFNHLMGLVGLNIASLRLNFEYVSWVNLAVTFILILSSHRFRTDHAYRKRELLRLSLFALITFLIGMTIETIGWKTGIPFGNYFYTDVMGPRFLGVPIIIGINWILLSYTCAQWMLGISSTTARIVAGSLLMVMIDSLLEGFAIRHRFWVWETGTPPLQNFLGWFITGLLIQWLFVKLLNHTEPTRENNVGQLYTPILLSFLLGDLLLSVLLF